MDSAGQAYLGVERSLSGRLWHDRGGDQRTAVALAQQLGVPEIVGRVLAARGIGIEQAEGVLNPTLKAAMPDPSHLLDMDRAAERIAEAVVDGEAVAVFGDYDVDGATSSALLQRFFAALERPLRIYIPDRAKEGYGPNAPALLALARDGVSLVITVDCGIMAFEPLAAAAAAGLDVIVVDHHQAEPRLPAAAAVINPNRLDQESEHGNLAAVGVAFLLVVAVNRCLRQRGWFAARPEPDLLQWLDLVALGTVCDVVPLTGLNRVLVAQGLKVLARRQNAGLAALADVAEIDNRPSTFHLGFLLGPRVNAGGRVGQADLGANLLISEDAGEARRIAERLDALNRERQEIEAEVLNRASDEVERQKLAEAPLIFIAGEDWHLGVVGIVASRLRERYHRPAFVLARGDAEIKGSGRSVPGIDLGAAVTAARQAGLLLAGGGHAMAAGITLAAERFDDVAAFLSERIASQFQDAPPSNGLAIDGSLKAAGATRELFETLEAAGPYGAGYPVPRFALPAVDVVNARIVGKGHVSLMLAGAEGRGRLRAISFRSADRALGQALLQASGRRFHIAGQLRADDWQGRRGVQLHLDDAAFA